MRQRVGSPVPETPDVGREDLKEYMTQQQKIIKVKGGLLELGRQIGHVSQACRVKGYSGDSFQPNGELIPEEVRSKVRRWCDYIDYRAVDRGFRNDTFMQGWVACRTRKERQDPLVCDPHAREKPGRYCIFVKVIDIFGNDTSQAFNVEVK